MPNEINDVLGKTSKDSEDSKTKKTSKSKDIPGLNEDILSQMMMTGDNETGMFSPDEKALKKELEPNEELHEEPTEEVKVGKIKGADVKDQYKKAMIEDMGKHPEKYSIKTPRGRMSVAEAIRQGFNPETGGFEKSLDEKNEEALSQLNDQDRANIEQFLDPAQVGLAPADAEAYGIPEGSPLRKTSTPIPSETPAAPVQAQEPQAIPPMQAAPQGNNILSMLGGTT